MRTYPEKMKEFWLYTIARLVLFLLTWGAVTGAWLLISGEASPGVMFLIAFVVSGIGSYFVLRGPREALARKVELRAARATGRYEEMRSREDAD